MRLIRALLAFTLAGLASFGALAQERGTRDEAKTLADQAVAHVKKVGPEQSFKDFSTDKATWTKKDLYVFVVDMKGQVVAHGANDKLIGKNMMELKDQNGKLFIKEMTDAVKGKGTAWVEYDWAHPQTKKIEGKATYAVKLSNYDGLVAVGIYR